MIAAFALAAAIASSPSPICQALAADYDGVSKQLAKIVVEGETDDSAPRATYREMRKQTELQRAAIMVTLMAQHHCDIPASAPDQVRYIEKWHACQTALTAGEKNPDQCKP